MGAFEARRLAVQGRLTLVGALSTIVLVLGWSAFGTASAGAVNPTRSSLGAATGSDLRGVSCPSGESCEAVGNDGNRTLVESWNGKRWSIVPSPSPGTLANALSGVSCVSPKSCEAVGVYRNGSGVARTLVESWNGKRWSVVTSPSPGGTLGSELSGVSCHSANSCSAVGSEGDAALTESWNGKIWTVAPNPSLLPRQSALQGVSCVSADSCAAVGVSGDATLVESWNGKRWTVVSTPTPGTYGGLSGVSCSRGGKCTGVGFYSTGTGSGTSTLPQTLVEAWNGSHWSVVQSPSPPVAYLYGISCVSPKSCAAVGDYPDNRGVARTLAESWNGKRWSIVPSPSPPAGDLYGVSCVSSRSCKAVGQYATNTSGTAPSRALIMSWNGRSWST